MNTASTKNLIPFEPMAQKKKQDINEIEMRSMNRLQGPDKKCNTETTRLTGTNFGRGEGVQCMGWVFAITCLTYTKATQRNM